MPSDEGADFREAFARWNEQTRELCGRFAALLVHHEQVAARAGAAAQQAESLRRELGLARAEVEELRRAQERAAATLSEVQRRLEEIRRERPPAPAAGDKPREAATPPRPVAVAAEPLRLSVVAPGAARHARRRSGVFFTDAARSVDEPK